VRGICGEDVRANEWRKEIRKLEGAKKMWQMWRQIREGNLTPCPGRVCRRTRWAQIYFLVEQHAGFNPRSPRGELGLAEQVLIKPKTKKKLHAVLCIHITGARQIYLFRSKQTSEPRTYSKKLRNVAAHRSERRDWSVENLLIGAKKVQVYLSQVHVPSRAFSFKACPHNLKSLDSIAN
jgi:hypothetical protein